MGLMGVEGVVGIEGVEGVEGAVAAHFRGIKDKPPICNSFKKRPTLWERSFICRCTRYTILNAL